MLTWEQLAAQRRERRSQRSRTLGPRPRGRGRGDQAPPRPDLREQWRGQPPQPAADEPPAQAGGQQEAATLS
eukprot:7894602-Lingulodinium_polyedra.AAC.1